MIRFHNNDDPTNKVVATLRATPGDQPTIDISAMFPDIVVELMKRLKEHEVIGFGANYAELTLPKELIEAFGDRPICFFFYLDKDGFHVNVRRAVGDNVPLFRLERTQTHVARIFAKNDEAKDFFVKMMGGGARAIFRLAQVVNDKTGDYETFIESEARPAGRLHHEVYELAYDLGTGNDIYTERKNVNRDELIEYVCNPEIHNIRVSRV